MRSFRLGLLSGQYHERTDAPLLGHEECPGERQEVDDDFQYVDHEGRDGVREALEAVRLTRSRRLGRRVERVGVGPGLTILDLLSTTLTLTFSVLVRQVARQADCTDEDHCKRDEQQERTCPVVVGAQAEQCPDQRRHEDVHWTEPAEPLDATEVRGAQPADGARSDTLLTRHHQQSTGQEEQPHSQERRQCQQAANPAQHLVATRQGLHRLRTCVRDHRYEHDHSDQRAQQEPAHGQHPEHDHAELVPEAAVAPPEHPQTIQAGQGGQDASKVVQRTHHPGQFLPQHTQGRPDHGDPPVAAVVLPLDLVAGLLLPPQVPPVRRAGRHRVPAAAPSSTHFTHLHGTSSQLRHNSLPLRGLSFETGLSYLYHKLALS